MPSTAAESSSCPATGFKSCAGGVSVLSSNAAPESPPLSTCWPEFRVKEAPEDDDDDEEDSLLTPLFEASSLGHHTFYEPFLDCRRNQVEVRKVLIFIILQTRFETGN